MMLSRRLRRLRHPWLMPGAALGGNATWPPSSASSWRALPWEVSSFSSTSTAHRGLEASSRSRPRREEVRRRRLPAWRTCCAGLRHVRRRPRSCAGLRPQKRRQLVAATRRMLRRPANLALPYYGRAWRRRAATSLYGGALSRRMPRPRRRRPWAGRRAPGAAPETPEDCDGASLGLPAGADRTALGSQNQRRASSWTVLYWASIRWQRSQR
mmetsp:Transcript_118254/g.264470  ORF Transcript_118254/g.264470 Transcript_118254/m.264470 type:complete len:212 (+) Transcript_118254:1102-1737(+)